MELVLQADQFRLEDAAGYGDEGVLDKVEPHRCRLTARAGGHLAPGGPEGGEGADDPQGHELAGRHVKCPGAEAAVGRRPDGELAARLMVKDLPRPLCSPRQRVSSGASRFASGAYGCRLSG